MLFSCSNAGGGNRGFVVARFKDYTIGNTWRYMAEYTADPFGKTH